MQIFQLTKHLSKKLIDRKYIKHFLKLCFENYVNWQCYAIRTTVKTAVSPEQPCFIRIKFNIQSTLTLCLHLCIWHDALSRIPTLAKLALYTMIELWAI